MSDRYRVHDSPLSILDTRPDSPPPTLAYAAALLGGLFVAVVPKEWSDGECGDYWRRELTAMCRKLNAREETQN